MTEASTSIQATDSLFLVELLKQIRAQDTYGRWDGKSDETLLEPFVLTKEKRKEIPLIGEPSPAMLQRLELFYNAVCMAIERKTGVMVSSVTKLHPEGWGRLMLTAGRLIVVNKQLRDVHRFGFASLEKLAEEGEKLVVQGIELIGQFPEVANYG